jgi:hypothetical protein
MFLPQATGKIIVLYILIFVFLDSKLEDRRSCTEAFPDFNLLLISSWMKFRFVRVVPRYLNCSTLSKDLLSISMLWFCPASLHCNTHHASLTCSNYTAPNSASIRTLSYAQILPFVPRSQTQSYLNVTSHVSHCGYDHGPFKVRDNTLCLY